MQFEELVEHFLKDPKFRKEYGKKDAANLAIRTSDQIVRARIRAGLTQEKLAKKVGTQQSSIARAERGTSLPSLAFLQKMAEAMGTHVIEPRFAFLYEMPRFSALGADSSAGYREARISAEAMAPSATVTATA